jgi:hypothetical protein
MTNLLVCDLCAGVENPDSLTPIHMNRQGQLFTFFFHNRRRDDCLSQKLTDLKSLFEMFGQNIPDIADYFGGE